MSLIQSLKAEGVLSLYHDYRSGSFRDFSGNDNDGTPEDVEFTHNALSFRDPSAEVAVGDAPELQLTEGTLVVFHETGFMGEQVTGGRIIAKRDAGTNYDWRIASASTITLSDGVTSSDIVTSFEGKKYVAINMKSGETPEGFIDGLSSGNYTAVTAIAADDAPLEIGSISSSTTLSFRNNMSAALVISRKLTATEHSQLYAELANTTWPKSVLPKSNANIDVNSNEPDLIVGFDMKPIGSALVDQSTLNNDGILDSGINHVKTPFGDGLRFNNGQIINVADNASLDITDALTCVMTVKVNNFNAGLNYLMEKGNNYEIGFDSIRRLFFFSTASEATTQIFEPDRYYRIGFSHDGAEIKFYIDGVLDSTHASVFGSVSGANLVFGGVASGATPLDGIIAGPVKLINATRDDNWFAGDYAELNKALARTDWGAEESVATETAGFLSNTPFTIDGGSVKITADTINGEDVKVIESISNSNLSMPTSFFQQDPTEAAFGKWEWYQKKTEAGVIRVGIGPGPNPITAGNYRIESLATEVLALTETGVAVLITAPDAVTVDAWEKITLTRTNEGVFELFLNEVSQGTATDLSIIESSVFSVELISGDRIALSNLSGDKSITKSITI